MSAMNIKPIFRYRFIENLKGVAVFFLVIVVLNAGVIASYFKGNTIQFSANSFSSIIVLFIFGICCIRENLRLSLQHGVSRRTAFTGELLATLTTAAILTLANEVLLVAMQAITAGASHFPVIDLYQLFYVEGNAAMSLGLHLQAVLMNIVFLLAAYLSGMVITMVFYRLNRFWTIVVAVGAPLLLFIVLPLLFAAAPAAPGRILVLIAKCLQALFQWFEISPWNLTLGALIAALALAAFNWLLIRRAPIRASKG